MSPALASAGIRADAPLAHAGDWRIFFEAAVTQSSGARVFELWFDGSLDLSTAIHPHCNDRYCLRWPEGEAEICFGTREIRVRPASDLVHRQNLERFAEAQILPRVLAHEGNLVLHASTVEVNGALIAFAGPSGTGKSTVAASLLATGHRLPGDDSLQVTNMRPGHFGSAVFPGLWLLPDSLAQLFPGNCRQTHGHATKTGVDIAMGKAQRKLALRVVYSLANADEIAIRRMPPSQACMAIIANSFALDPTDIGRSRAKLSAATSLVESVPVYELSYPRRYDRLDAVRDEILRHCDECIAQVGTGRS